MYPSVRTESSRGTREGNIYNFCLLRFLHRWPSIDPSTEWIGQRKRQQIRISRARVNTVSPTRRIDSTRVLSTFRHGWLRFPSRSVKLHGLIRIWSTSLSTDYEYSIRSRQKRVSDTTRFESPSNLYLFYSILLLLLLLSMKDLRFSARLLFQLYWLLSSS